MLSLGAAARRDNHALHRGAYGVRRGVATDQLARHHGAISRMAAHGAAAWLALSAAYLQRAARRKAIAEVSSWKKSVRGNDGV